MPPTPLYTLKIGGWHIQLFYHTTCYKRCISRMPNIYLVATLFFNTLHDTKRADGRALIFQK